MTISTETAVERIIEAQSGPRLLAPLSETYGNFTLEQAYAIQDALRTELERRGQRPLGWKLGATSPSGQAVMGVTEPCSGFLTPRRYASGSGVSASEFVGLGVEAEVAFTMRTRLVGPGVTAEAALRAVEGALAALELADFIFTGTPRVVDFVASSIVAKAIVLGGPLTPLWTFDVAGEEVVYEHNGRAIGTSTAAEVMGSPVNALVWLANHLAARGLALEPGDVVMSGAVSKVLRPKAGDTIRASFAHLGSVSVTIEP